MFNFDRAFFDSKSTAIVSSAKRSLIDRQRDIYDSHRHRVFSISFYMTGNELLAEQTLGNTFVKAFQVNAEPDAASVDSALMGELREMMEFDPVEPATALLQESLPLGNVRRTALEEAIGELPAIERLAFLLKDVEGYSIDTMSELMELPRGDLARILMSARIRMRSILASKAADSASTPKDSETDEGPISTTSAAA